MSVGHSGTPLASKLGLREGSTVLLVGAPPDYAALTSPLPAGVRFVEEASYEVDLAHVFSADRSALADWLTRLRTTLRPDATVWISWPKKASRVPSTITEDVIRELCLPMGWVDVKVCAVSPVWSGLKLVVRKELR